EGVDQINRAIADMDRITQENSALVEQNTTASQHMAEEAENLQDLLNTFKVEESDASSSEHINENKQNNLKLGQNKFKQIPDKTVTGKPASQTQNTVNENLPPFK
ncbi:MAG: hypothetical protein ACKVJ3_06175, partial [bacterium]